MKRIAPRLVPPLLRLTGGRVSSMYPVPIMLLTTTGAKTGQRRTLPLLYVTYGDAIILIASNYGKTTHQSYEGRAGDRTIPLVRLSRSPGL